jgi:4-hydroxy-tetrahydrodipicolinate synthase
LKFCCNLYILSQSTIKVDIQNSYIKTLTGLLKEITMAKKLQGIFAVLVTPFTKDDKIDEKILRKHIRYLIDKGGVHGIMPTGSTGECAALSDEERMLVADIAISEADGAVPVVVGTSAASTKAAIRFSQYAQNAGADGVLTLPGYYSHPDPREICEHYKSLSKNIDIPVMVYNNPSPSGVDMKPGLIAQLAEFDNISYIKESSGDMTRVAEIQRLCGEKLTVFCGCDALAMEMFLMGAAGWVAPPANLIPKQCVKLFELAYVRQDIKKAKEFYLRLLPLFSLFESSGKYVQLTKAGLGILGRPYGSPRKPLLPPDKELLNQFKKILKEIAG